MAVYCVFGKLGVGKTKLAVWQAQKALRAGLKVASNVDLFQPLTPEKPLRYIRVPDKPTADDLDAIGHGNPDSYDEDDNGVLILDELGSWLNARAFQDKARAGVIEWLIHARKRGWNVFLLVQDPGMIDKQVREALCEYMVNCIRLDKVRMPLFGKLLGAVTGNRKAGYLPRFHLATARLGSGESAVVAERWMYRGDDLHAAYDTRQIFTTAYPHGSHSVLPAWDWQSPDVARAAMKTRIRDRVAAVLSPPPRPRPPLKPKLPHVAAIATLHPDARLAALRAARAPRVRQFLADLAVIRAAEQEAEAAIQRAATSSRLPAESSDAA